MILASSVRSSIRGTIRSTKPCLSRNSLVWKPSGNSRRMVSRMVRRPAKPIMAPGSARVMSPCSAKLAATRTADDDERQFQARRRLGGAGDLLADHRAHAAGHEREISNDEYHRPATDVAAADHRRVGHAGLALFRLEPFGVGQTIAEA